MPKQVFVDDDLIALAEAIRAAVPEASRIPRQAIINPLLREALRARAKSLGIDPDNVPAYEGRNEPEIEDATVR